MDTRGSRFKPLTTTILGPQIKSLLSCCVVFFVICAPLHASSNDPDGGSGNTGDSTPGTPRYALLYDRLLLQEKAGKLVEALQLVPEIYLSDIPVDSFYHTLENKREQLLEAISQKETVLRAGKERYAWSDLSQIFRLVYLKKADRYQHVVQVSGDLDLLRFCYFMIIAGARRKDHFSPFDLQTLLTSADPWLVSAALFVARNLYGTPGIVRKTIRPDYHHSAVRFYL